MGKALRYSKRGHQDRRQPEPREQRQAGGQIEAAQAARERVEVGMAAVVQIAPTWLNPDGSLNPERLLAVFLHFWGQYGQPVLGDDRDPGLKLATTSTDLS